MNLSNFRISLDIHDMSSQVSISVKRGDTCRRICAVLTENGKPYVIADGCAAKFRMKKPADSTGERAIVFNDCDIENNTICYTLISGYTNIAGVADCEFNLYGAEGQLLTSPHFTVVIDNTVVSDEEVETEGSAEVSALTALLARTEALKKEIETKLNNGDFVGAKGEPGYTPIKGVDYFDGKDGYTPIKGVDYFTEADKEELREGLSSSSPIASDQFSNVLKATAYGTKALTVYGLHPVEHKMSIQIVNDDITDFVGETLYRCGLNMFKPWSAEATVNGVTAKLTEDGFVETSGTFSGTQTKISLYPPADFEYVTYPATRYDKYLDEYEGFTTDDIDFQFQFVYEDGSVADTLTSSGTKKFNSPVKLKGIDVIVKNANGANAKIPPVFNISELWVEEYVPYVDVTSHIVDANGVVEGVYSVLPETVLFSTNMNLSFQVEYNQDINDAISYLTWMLEELEGRLSKSISRVSWVELLADGWQGEQSPYSQVVDLEEITYYSKVDINPDIEQLAEFHEKDIAFVAENNDGEITVYCIGQKPENDHYVQVTITEVESIG